jgi:hypothetical protein
MINITCKSISILEINKLDNISASINIETSLIYTKKIIEPYMKNLKKSHKIIINIIVIGAILFWFINVNLEINKRELKIKDKGCYLIGILLKKDATKGGHRTFEYSFVFAKRYYSDRSYVDQSLYYKKQIGDTIIIKTHKDLLPFSIVCEDLVYKSCMGKPPKGGWKEIPSCNDK